MEYVTKEQFDNFYNTFKNRAEIEVNELYQVMEKQFGYGSNKLPRPLSPTQKDEITRVIFSNEDVLDQLKKSKLDRDKGIIPYSNDVNDFAKLVNELNDER